MKHLRSGLCISLVFVPLVALCQGSGAAAANPRPFANGVYAVLGKSPKAQEVCTGKAPHAVLIYEGKYSEVDKDQPPTFVALDLSTFVPLVLAGNPGIHTDDRGYAALTLALAQQHVKRLEDFTRVHLGGEIAIVIDGDIVTMHRVRSIIKDGKAQITRCTDNACQRLYLQLTR